MVNMNVFKHGNTIQTVIYHGRNYYKWSTVEYNVV